MYPEGWGIASALMIFVGFNVTFFPQFILGYNGMPRRYWEYAPEYQVLNVMSTAGASVLAIGFLLPVLYFLWSLYWGEKAEANPSRASGLEWHVSSPPPVHNFYEKPVVTRGPYHYDHLDPEFEETQAETTVEAVKRGETPGA
jgi:cytochrome c oxidase subunit 1